MTCSRCGAALQNQMQFDRGLCASCLTGASLSALVGLAAESSHRRSGSARDLGPAALAPSPSPVGIPTPTFQPPIYFGRSDFEGLPENWPSDTEWKHVQEHL